MATKQTLDSHSYFHLSYPLEAFLKQTRRLLCSYHLRFASVSMLAWVGRVLIMAILHVLRFWASSGLSFTFLRSLLTEWDHVFFGSPCSRLPSITTCLQALAGFSASILISVFFSVAPQ